jgi:anti-sigma regulatory factor (Ser/Thr protein kinase)
MPQLRLVYYPAPSAPEGSFPERFDLEMPSDVSEVAAAVELAARHCFSEIPVCARTAFRFRVALAEALSNAILRGNHEDGSKLVRVRAELWPSSIRLGVEDEGDGFDHGRVGQRPLPEAIDAERGRGLAIIRHLVDQVEFNARGNTIWMTLPRC